MLGALNRNLRPVLRQTRLRLFGLRKTPTCAAQIRCATTSAALRLQDDCLVLNYEGTPLRFNYVWLRDHCRSASSFNSATNQRNVDTGSIDLSIRPQSTAVEDGQLVLTWPDGHVSKYDLSWLARNSYEGQKRSIVQPRVFWNLDIYEKANIESAKWDTFLTCDHELKKFLRSYLLYGVAFVDGVPATVEATKEVTQRVSLMRETTYGGMWSFTSDLSRGDTAYTQLALDRHTDTSYFQEPCGIQVFHCLKHEGTGGRTLLVDGFYAAEKLRQRSPENFELLSTVHIGHEYIESSDRHQNHMRGVGPVLNVYPWNNELYLIRYNNYDRSVINTIPHDVVQRWYVAHRQLTTELRRPENELWVKLTPGKVKCSHNAKSTERCDPDSVGSKASALPVHDKVVFIDNWRVMHGREAFTGTRQLCGCYLTRDDVLSTARCFGLQA